MNKWIIKDVMVFCDFQIIFEILYVFWILHDKREAEPSSQSYLTKEETSCNSEYLYSPLTCCASSRQHYMTKALGELSF